MKILLTGACGFLISYLTKLLLEKEHEVIGYDNCSGRSSDSLISFCSNPLFKFIRGDILNKELLRKSSEGVDLVVHGAAYVGEPLCAKYPEFAWLVNYEGTKNIADLNIPTIFCSTNSVLGRCEETATEESVCNPLSIYAKSKLEAEKYLLSLGNCVVLRFSTAMGLASSSLRLDLLPNDFTYQAWKNHTITIAQADFKRSFINCRDLMDATAFAIENFGKLKGEVYNVANETCNITKRQLGELLKKKTGCSLFFDDSIYSDCDMRFYYTSAQKFKNKGWEARIGMEETIDELLKAMPIININNQYYQRL